MGKNRNKFLSIIFTIIISSVVFAVLYFVPVKIKKKYSDLLNEDRKEVSDSKTVINQSLPDTISQVVDISYPMSDTAVSEEESLEFPSVEGLTEAKDFKIYNHNSSNKEVERERNNRTE